ncbi:MAG: hypothetical protein HY690_16740 [Chloroflexi bacterium]|nr:hypothetical protein [Chloroflexota bacterium]
MEELSLHQEEDDMDDTIETMPSLESFSFEDGVRYLMEEGITEDEARQTMVIVLGLSPGDAVSFEERQRWERKLRAEKRHP